MRLLSYQLTSTLQAASLIPKKIRSEPNLSVVTNVRLWLYRQLKVSTTIYILQLPFSISQV
jgi:hypothetical protein